MPLILPQYFTPERIAEFWSRVDRSGEHWLWVGVINPGGYGSVWRFTNGAHRLAWFLATGEDPGSKYVLHTCDIPRCVRNDEIGVYSVVGIEYPRRGHLFLGDALANRRDRIQKHRARKMVSVPKIAVEIRDLYRTGMCDKFQLAWEFDIPVLMVSDIVKHGL